MGGVRALDAVLPVISILIGAGITYYVNVRGRRRTYVEDLFNEAIAAVAVAEASIDYLAGAGRPKHLTDDEYTDLQKWMVTEGMKNWTLKVAAANEALARVLPYLPELAATLPLHLDADHRSGTDVIVMLKRGREAQ